MEIKELYDKCAHVDIEDLTSKQKTIIYNNLRSMKSEDLKSLEEHKMYVEILRKLRLLNTLDSRLNGEHFLGMLKSLLSVGEDGVYSNSYRFIYELIQNVDDCEYDNAEDCKLDIKFDDSYDIGKIVLTYNEKGFTPENVFAITGIAEKSKNVLADKVEIGEKGIGFKSVFGIADKVYIESGSFSFELYKDNFTIPIPKYDDFKPIDGTRMTLEMPSELVRQLYYYFENQYKKESAILNQNPILFLNKLTHLKLYKNKWTYISFDVERKNPKIISDDIMFMIDHQPQV